MNLNYERKKINNGLSIIIGCDEVGRGSLAGPVVAAATAVDLGFKIGDLKLKEIKDSKLLSEKKREELSKLIKEHLVWGVGEVDVAGIERLNILQASLLAMRKAVEEILQKISVPPETVLVCVDGKFTIPNLELKQEAVVDGDNKIFSIAAASIVAKVYRDELMCRLAGEFPEYGFEKHKGYGTLHHRQQIKKHGLTPLHRKSFCKKFLK